MTPLVYLAGPDVFHPEHVRIFAERASLCHHHGLRPLVPLDNDAKTAAAIYSSNLELLDRCDAVIANITPFRGPHCDVGTAWEIGYAVARGTPVFAFSQSTQLLVERVAVRDAQPFTDSSGMLVENFDLSENVMIASSLVEQRVHESFEAAVEAAAKHVKVKPRRLVP